MEYEIDIYNQYQLPVKAKYSTCPICSKNRKKKTQKCMMLDWNTAIGTCQHCGAVIQLHSYKRHKLYDKNRFNDRPTSQPTKIGTIINEMFEQGFVNKEFIDNIEYETVRKSLTGYSKNYFIHYLNSLFGKTKTNELIDKYRIGTSKHWKGATVFWQIDQFNKVHTGKIMLYNPITGKRVKSPINHISWVHSVLKLTDFKLKQCFFGEHLLKQYKPIAIVESEKTAIIASAYIPEFNWLAVGSLNNLNARICRVLEGKTVALYPDLNAFNKWKDKAKEIETKINVKFIIPNLLQKKSTDEEKINGYDLADYLVEQDWLTINKDASQQEKLDKLIKINPNIQNMIDLLDLELC